MTEHLGLSGSVSELVTEGITPICVTESLPVFPVIFKILALLLLGKYWVIC